MAELERAPPESRPRCRRCGAQMKDVVTIAPVLNEPGLIAYECPRCGWVTSELIIADGISRLD
jgi:hypothetical protein